MILSLSWTSHFCWCWLRATSIVYRALSLLIEKANFDEEFAFALYVFVSHSINGDPRRGFHRTAKPRLSTLPYGLCLFLFEVSWLSWFFSERVPFSTRCSETGETGAVFKTTVFEGPFNCVEPPFKRLKEFWGPRTVYSLSATDNKLCWKISLAQGEILDVAPIVSFLT